MEDKNILNKKKGICILDVTGPVFFGKQFKNFFNIKTFDNGINYYIGLDKKKYKINIFAYMKDYEYINLVNGKKFIKVYYNLKQKILYYNNNNHHYSTLWNKNIIFK